MKGLTKKQYDVLQYIKKCIDDNRVPPSYREIKEYFGYSSLGTVYDHIKTLKRKGYIKAEEHSARSISVEDAQAAEVLGTKHVPIVGSVQAGFPIRMSEKNEEIDVSPSLLRGLNNPYALKVVGDGFFDELLGDGDVIIVDARDHVYDGEMAILESKDQEVIIRCLFHEGSYIRLTAITHHQQPIILRKGGYTIHGIVHTVIRELYHRI